MPVLVVHSFIPPENYPSITNSCSLDEILLVGLTPLDVSERGGGAPGNAIALLTAIRIVSSSEQSQVPVTLLHFAYESCQEWGNCMGFSREASNAIKYKQPGTEPYMRGPKYTNAF